MMVFVPTLYKLFCQNQNLMNGLVARAQNIYLRPRIHKKNDRHLETELEKCSFDKYVEDLRWRVFIPVRPFLHNLKVFESTKKFMTVRWW